MDEANIFDKKRAHKERHAGRKVDKKNLKRKAANDPSAEERNPKAFSFNSTVKAQRRFVRTQDIKSKKYHIPVVDRAPLEPPPVIVAVVGGPKVGKSTLMKCLIKHYTNQKLSNINGPVTVITGKKTRVTLIEVNNDINCMVDIAKVADVVLLLIDATFGIEMEVFEFLEICRAHGEPRVIGVLNHLDMLKDNKALKKKKKILKKRFQVELYPGAKLFYLSGIRYEDYLKNEVKNLARFISVMKFRPLAWRSSHPYVLADRYEDITNPEEIRTNPKCDRDIVLYGYVRGVPLKENQKVHIMGCCDTVIRRLTCLDDPCPLPEKLKKRSLNTKEKLVYAPLSGVGGVLYDEDAVYIDLGGSHHGRKTKDENDEEEEEESIDQSLLKPLIDLQKTTDEKRAHSQIKLFKDTDFIEKEVSEDDSDFEEGSLSTSSPGTCEQSLERRGKTNPELSAMDCGRQRRRVHFETPDDALIHSDSDVSDDDDDDDDQSSDGENYYCGDHDDDDNDEDDAKEWKEIDTEPPKKRQKSCRDEDDSDNDDLDEELETIRRESSGQQKSVNPGISVKFGIAKNVDSEVVSKIMGLLNKIKPKEKEASSDLNEEDRSGEENDNNDYDEDDMGDDYQFEMIKQAKSNYFENQSRVSYLRKYIYSKELEEAKDEEEIVIGEIFRKTKTMRRAEASLEDTARYNPPVLRNWKDNEVLQSVKDCFVTGQWHAKDDAATLLKMNDEIYGDFEDLETGKVYKQMEQEEAKKEEQVDSNETSKSLSYEEKKKRLKELFDAEYDDKTGDYYETLKNEMSQQSQLNKSEFEGLDDETRILYEGFRTGLYVSMRFSKMPCEFITNMNPTYPVIVGGLLDNEDSLGYVKVRLKVHRWYPKILKNKDPLILSLGWRRFQSVMQYAKREDNFRLRSLKYARKYLHVEALFWGPVTPVNTGFVAFQNITERKPEFQIAANGVVIEADQSTQLVKKLKLIGYPDKVMQKTAFIKNMFHSDLECSKFIGAKIMTQSGIRGLIKKAQGLEGNFRAKFEDTIKFSDIIILKTWASVEIMKCYTIVRSLLLPPDQKASWLGMRTVAEIKSERGIKFSPNADSLYKPVESRREYYSLPLRIPKELQRALPYEDKPKNMPEITKAERVLVVKDSEEIKMDKFMERLKVMMEEKRQKEEEEKANHRRKYQLEIEAREKKRQIKERQRKAAICKKRSRGKKKNIF